MCFPSEKFLMTCPNYCRSARSLQIITSGIKQNECLSLLQVFKLERVESKLEPLCIESNLTVKEMLERVLRLPAVASKRYLTNKVC